MNPYIEVVLPNPKKVKTLGNNEIEITKIEIFEIVDSNIKKQVTAHCRNHPTKIVLWKDAEYDNIGQWTNDNVISRVLELYS